MEYKFSITKRYVHDWGLIEGVREILQNAIDSDGEMVIDIGDDCLSISNKNTTIPIKSLLLGYGTKTNDSSKVGGHSEGSLLAIMTLLRCGYDVDITNGSEKWIPSFKYDEGLQEEVFCIDTEPCNNTYCLTYQISGLSSYEIEELQDTFLDLNKLGSRKDLDTIRTRYGEIIKTPEMAGKMFVDGLPIYTDEDFKFGYNFKPEFVTLDRDRKSINRSELRKITTLALTYMEEPDYDMLDKAIDKGSEDIYYLENNLEDVSEDFIQGYGEHLKERFEIDDKTVVSTKNDLFDTICNKYSDQINSEEIKVKTVDKSIYSKILNTVCPLSSEIISKEKEIKREQTKIEEAWDNYEYSDFKSFKEFLDKIRNKLTNEEITEYRCLLYNIEPGLFHLISDEVWIDYEDIDED